MRQRKAILGASLAIAFIALSGCSNTDVLSEEAAKLHFPKSWVKIGETPVNSDLERTYLAPPGNTDDQLQEAFPSGNVTKERPVDDTGQGELHFRVLNSDSRHFWRTTSSVDLTVGPVLTVDEAAAKDSYTRDKKTISAKADELCGITPSGQELCDDKGTDKVQVVTVEIDIDRR